MAISRPEGDAAQMKMQVDANLKGGDSTTTTTLGNKTPAGTPAQPQDQKATRVIPPTEFADPKSNSKALKSGGKSTMPVSSTTSRAASKSPTTSGTTGTVVTTTSTNAAGAAMPPGSKTQNLPVDQEEEKNGLEQMQALTPSPSSSSWRQHQPIKAAGMSLVQGDHAATPASCITPGVASTSPVVFGPQGPPTSPMTGDMNYRKENQELMKRMNINASSFGLFSATTRKAQVEEHWLRYLSVDDKNLLCFQVDDHVTRLAQCVKHNENEMCDLLNLPKNLSPVYNPKRFGALNGERIAKILVSFWSEEGELERKPLLGVFFRYVDKIVRLHKIVGSSTSTGGSSLGQKATSTTEAAAPPVKKTAWGVNNGATVTVEKKKQAKIVLDGSWLGRLTYEFLAKGYGDLFEVATRFADPLEHELTKQMLNPDRTTWTMYPYAADRNNRIQYDEHLRPITFPDIFLDETTKLKTALERADDAKQEARLNFAGGEPDSSSSCSGDEQENKTGTAKSSSKKSAKKQKTTSTPDLADANVVNSGEENNKLKEQTTASGEDKKKSGILQRLPAWLRGSAAKEAAVLEQSGTAMENVQDVDMVSSQNGPATSQMLNLPDVKELQANALKMFSVEKLWQQDSNGTATSTHNSDEPQTAGGHQSEKHNKADNDKIPATSADYPALTPSVKNSSTVSKSTTAAVEEGPTTVFVTSYGFAYAPPLKLYGKLGYISKFISEREGHVEKESSWFLDKLFEVKKSKAMYWLHIGTASYRWMTPAFDLRAEQSGSGHLDQTNPTRHKPFSTDLPLSVADLRFFIEAAGYEFLEDNLQVSVLGQNTRAIVQNENSTWCFLAKRKDVVE
ncbi:unnamed protein product [Amoebophrya sp. A120]|nr:unnamed protein product [Amoebophrya sp. A120]|eukprot:GSA120T00011174001.1